MKRAREAAGLTLAEVSQRCEIDQPDLSRVRRVLITARTRSFWLWRQSCCSRG
jgi:hypothetical protein